MIQSKFSVGYFDNKKSEVKGTILFDDVDHAIIGSYGMFEKFHFEGERFIIETYNKSTFSINGITIEFQY